MRRLASIQEFCSEFSDVFIGGFADEFAEELPDTLRGAFCGGNLPPSAIQRR